MHGTARVEPVPGLVGRLRALTMHRTIVIGWTVETVGGSVWRIAPISEAWLAPENAFFPVAIS